jgi:sec-independent protein translocase protein TatA
MNTFLAFGPFGTTEMIIVAILVLVLFGAKKLPTFARSLGRSMQEFKHAKDDFEREMRNAADEVEAEVKPKLPETKPVARERDHADA